MKEVRKWIRRTIIILVIAVLCFAGGTAAADSDFIDVPSTHPFYNAVKWAKDNGITGGYTGAKAGYFGINDPVTRGQVIMFLWRAANKPDPKKKTQTFSDVSTTHNFYKAIQWAAEQKIAAGYSGSRAGMFGVNDSCTRGQIVTFLWRYAGTPAPKKSAQTFSDVSTSHSFYKAVQWASEKKITSGYKDGSFGVNTTCTRGHCVTFLYRLVKGDSSGSSDDPGSDDTGDDGDNPGNQKISLSSVDPNTFYVYIPRTGTKFHSRSTCGTMKNPSRVLLKDVLSAGKYDPCSNCWKD